jgi:hypothetical protein
VRTAVAIVAGVLLFLIGVGMFRSLLGPRRGPESSGAVLEVAERMPEGVRVLYWCETCGTEVLLLRKGSDAAPRHCGESMTRREEILKA